MVRRVLRGLGHDHALTISFYFGTLLVEHDGVEHTKHFIYCKRIIIQ